MGPGATVKLLLGGAPFEAGLNEAASGLAAMGVHTGAGGGRRRRPGLSRLIPSSAVSLGPSLGPQARGS